MKYSFGLLIFLLPLFAAGQVATSPGARALSKLEDLREWWTVGIDSATDAVDMRTFNRFKNLFTHNATIADAFDVVYQYGKEGRGAYRRNKQPKSFDVYAHNVALQIRSIRVADFSIIQADTTNSQRMVFDVKTDDSFRRPRRYVLPENFADNVLSSRPAITYDGKENSALPLGKLNDFLERTQDSVYTFSYQDTLRIVMVQDTGDLRIATIESRSNNIVSTNDSDADAVLDSEDSLTAKDRPGDFTAQGKPDYDLDGEPDLTDKCRTTYGTGRQGCPPSYFITRNRIDVFIGFQSHTQKVARPELNQLGYRDAGGADAMDVLQSRKGVLVDPGRLTGFYAGGNYAIFLGRRKKKSGISIGVTYSKFTGDYSLTDRAVYTFKASDGVNLYRRQISLRSLQEEISYTAINVPLLFNYRMKFGPQGNTVLTLKAGPSFVLFKNVSNYNALADFGGIYQIDTVTKDRITWYDFFNEGSRYNLYMTSSRLNGGNAQSPAADSIFRQLQAKGFDFAKDKPFAGEQNLSRTAVAFNVAIDLQRKVSDGLTAKIGLHFVNSPSVQGKQPYKPVDKTTDEFQSVYNSNVKSSYSALGLNLGFVFEF